MTQDGSELLGILTSLPGRYAKALYDVAQHKQISDKILDDLSLINTQIEASEELRKALNNPSFARRDLKKVLSNVAQSLNLSQELIAFLEMLAMHRRVNLLESIKKIYQDIVRQIHNLQEVSVTSAYPLTSSQKKELSEILSTFSNSTVEIRFHEDSTLLGGLVVQLGNKIIDASLAVRLTNFSHTMKGTR